ncbi:TPA: DNA topoisomerase III [Klebsiella oxytoca]|uniref:DNA topoisomerase n=1 Tax=Klebsiella oxytoca TaxID=571 RepID=A0AAN5RFS8_KLEOX|nr:DNA topoisomerase III [Klebsiella oxytoca]
MQLYLCEKPSQARDIASVLGRGQKGDGCIHVGSNIIVTWARGHLLEQAAPDKYDEKYGKPWRTGVLPIIPSQWKLEVVEDAKGQFRVIRELLKKASEVVVSTDADREGEVIARELLEYCAYRGPVRRLWLSALDEASIRKGLANLLPGEKTALLYDAGKGRSRADWLVGMNMTRLCTLLARDAGVDELLSVGRVQTPTLAIVVNRDNEIANFVPVPYWQVRARLQKDGVMFSALWQPAEQYSDGGGRCIHQGAAAAVLQLCAPTATATVLDATTARKKEPQPLCFSLGALQVACSQKWGMGAKDVLGIAQALYETHKATTYPRTDCGYLPVSMLDEVPEVLDAIAKSDPSVAATINTLDRTLRSRVWNDKKITAHHGIIPTRMTFDISRLSADELKVYILIRQHYLAQLLPQAEVDVTEASFNLGGQLFRTRGRVPVLEGWKALFRRQDDAVDDQGTDATPTEEEERDMALPPLAKGDSCQVSGGEKESEQTRPPSPFTEGTLIAAMKNAASLVTDPKLKKILRDNAGLGTEATRAEVITTLFKRGYLEKKGKILRSTPLARELIAALPETLTSPGMTALWEQALDDIAEGRMPLDAFMQKQEAWARHLVEKLRAESLKLTAPVTPPCPTCGGKTSKRSGKKGDFFSCIRYPECKGVVNSNGKRNVVRNKGRKTDKSAS